MIKVVNIIVGVLLLIFAGCVNDTLSQKMEAESLAGKWRMISKNGDQSRDLGMTITFNENGSWNSFYQADYKRNPIISGGRFTIEANKVHLFSTKKKQEQEEIWFVVNPSLLRQKAEGANEDDKASLTQTQGIFLERLK